MNPDARMFFGRTPPPKMSKLENRYCPRCLITTVQKMTPNGEFECQRCAKMKAMKFEDRLNFIFRNTVDEDDITLKFIPMIW